MQLLVKTVCAFIFLFCSVGLSAQSEVSDTSLATTDTLSRAERLFQEGEILKSEQKWQEGFEKFDEAATAFLEEGDIAGFEKTGQYINFCAFRTKTDVNTLLDYYNEKTAFCEEYFGTENIQTGIWYFYIGKIYSGYLKQFDPATEYLEKALNIFQKSKERPLKVTQIFTDLSFIQINLGNYSEAEAILNKSIGALKNFLEENIIDEEEFEKQLSTHYSYIGLVKKQEGSYEEAIRYYNKSIELDIKHDNDQQLAINYYDVGFTYLQMNAPLKAKGFLHKAVSTYKKIYGEHHSYVGAAYTMLGNLYSELSEFEKAIEYFEKAAANKIQNFGEKNVGLGITYFSMARTWYKLYNIEKAEHFFYKAKNIYEEIFPDPAPQKINLYNALSYFWAHQKTKLDSAEILLKQALKDGKLIYGERHLYVSESLRSLAFLYVQKQEFDTALEYIQKALVANSFQFSGLDISEYPPVGDFIDDSKGLSALNRKSYILKKLWNEDKNNEKLIRQVQACAELSNRMIDEMTKTAEGQLKFSKHLHSNINNAGKLAIADNFDFYRHTNRSEFIEQYLFWMEKLKAQQLALTFQNAEAQNFAKIPNELIESEKSYLHQIDSLEQLLYAAFESKDSTAIDKIQNESLFGVKRAQENFIAGLEENYPDYYQLKYDLKSVKLSELKQSLNENELFLEYFANENEAPEANELFFLALTNREEHIFKTDLPQDYDQKITTFNKLLRSHNLLRADRRRKFIELSHELYNQFIQPIEHLLEGKDRLVIVGEGVTHYLSFGVLLKSNEEKPWHELDFLIRDHEISYHYSGTLFARAQAHKPEFDNELLAFAPVFSEPDNTLAALREGGLEMADSTFRSVEGDNFSPLPHSEKEVKNISQLFPKSSKINVLLNQNANESNLKSALEKNHRFVHIASHSFANIDYPNFSGIACAESDSEAKKDDGILYVGEIYNLAVNSDLVVLSSCESGVGKLSGGEGMLGLNRSFVYAGVPNVIFSLWKVYDEATGQMMTEFYKNTLNGDSYSKALRAAKLKMLENPTTATPDIWGAFLLLGR